MIKKLCIFTINFSFNRQVILNNLEKILPKEVEMFLFVTKECKGKYYSKRAKIVESPFSKYVSFFEFRKFCKKNKIERSINLGSLPQEGLVMAFATLLTKSDFVAHLLVNPTGSLKLGFDKWWVKFLIEDIVNYFFSIFPRKIFISSKDILKICKRYVFFSRKKFQHFPTMVNTSFFTLSDKSKARKKLGLKEKQKIIIFVGRIERAKGADVILKIAKRNKDIVFILIGKPDQEFLRIGELPNIHIDSSISDEKLRDYYNASDLCLFPSKVEAFGLAPREAMSCGIPTIVSDVMCLRLIQPAIKSSLNFLAMESKIREFFNLSFKQKSIISSKSREFVVNECGNELCKRLYRKKLLEKQLG